MTNAELKKLVKTLKKTELIDIICYLSNKQIITDAEFVVSESKLSKSELADSILSFPKTKKLGVAWTSVIFNVVLLKIEDAIKRNIKENARLNAKWTDADAYNSVEIYEAIIKNHREYERLNKRYDYISNIIFK